MCDNTGTNRASQLANDHWEGYVKQLLVAHGHPAELVKIIGFHYISSAIHFYKHGVEDGQFNAAVERDFSKLPTCPLPGTPRYNEIHTPLKPEEVGAIASTMMFDGKMREVADAIDFRLPSITLPGDKDAVWKKYCEERTEWSQAESGSMDELIESWDCVQALQTFKERGGTDYTDSCSHKNELRRHQLEGRDVMGAKWLMLEKNAKRGYYSPAVCQAILDGTWTPDTDI